MLRRRKMINRKAEILAEHVIFIVLNLIFLTILVLFLFLKSGDAAVLEERYAKQIALAIDSAQPVMKITLNMKDAKSEADKYLGEENFGEVVEIKDNVVTVKLREDGGYSYSFFNDVDVVAYPDKNLNNDFTGKYIITINEK